MPALGGLGAGHISKMVAAFTTGDGNILEKLVEKKLESIGENFLIEPTRRRLEDGATDRGGDSVGRDERV